MRLMIALTIVLALPPAALGESPAPPTPMDHHAAAPATGADTPATTAFEAIAEAMHGDMAIDYTGEVDVDLVRLMIPHHVSAVEMAKVLLEHSSDPATRALAEDVIVAQEAEIEMMREYIRKQTGGE